MVFKLNKIFNIIGHGFRLFYILPTPLILYVYNGTTTCPRFALLMFDRTQ